MLTNINSIVSLKGIKLNKLIRQNTDTGKEIIKIKGINNLKYFIKNNFGDYYNQIYSKYLTKLNLVFLIEDLKFKEINIFGLKNLGKKIEVIQFDINKIEEIFLYLLYVSVFNLSTQKEREIIQVDIAKQILLLENIINKKK